MESFQPPPPPSLMATELVIIVRVARIATREKMQLLKVFAEAPRTPASDHKRFFAVSVQEGNENSLTFSNPLSDINEASGREDS